jgi:hypothetical protein
MNPDEDDEEIQAAKDAGFRVVHQRTDVLDGELVIGRYSVLPFYKELERDIRNQGADLINTYRQHRFLADMREWVPCLKGLTPKLYHRLQDLPDNGGPFVLKGETNSKKYLWNTHMYAADKRAAGEVYSRLQDDMLLAQQEIYVRDYVPLKRLATGFNELPIANEFRFFVLYGQVLCGAFYWSSHVADLASVPSAAEYKTRQEEWRSYQGWLVNRNETRSELERKWGYDTKHGMHLIRLMRMCREILEGKGVLVKRPDSEELLAIRNGLWTYDQLLEWAERQETELDELYKTSTLPKSPPILELDKLLVDTVESLK